MKDKIIVILFLSYIMIFSIFHIVLKDNEISTSERRKLDTFPKFELNSEYITKVDEYLLDHFPLRNSFRSLKANYNYYIMGRLDNNDIYLKDNYIFKSNYPTDQKSINNFVKNINNTTKLLNENNNVYMLVIPDKNYYLNDNNFLQLDYELIYNEINVFDNEM